MFFFTTTSQKGFIISITALGEIVPAKPVYNDGETKWGKLFRKCNDDMAGINSLKCVAKATPLSSMNAVNGEDRCR